MEILIGVLCFLALVAIFLIIIFRPRQNNQNTTLSKQIENLQTGFKEDFRINREENNAIGKDNRTELSSSLKEFKSEMTNTLKAITEQNQKALELINKTLEEKISALITKTDEANKTNRDSLTNNLKDFTLEQRTKFADLRQEQKDLTAKTTEQLDKITGKVEEKLTGLTEQAKADSNLMR